MKIDIYIILILCLFITGCKRKRKVNIEGSVTDIYTWQPAPNVKVQLHSQIEVGVSGGTTNDYETLTNTNGHYQFTNAVFSKPGNHGWVEIVSNSYELVDLHASSQDISGKEIKFIGKTNLVKNINVIGLSNLNISLNFSPSIQVTSAAFYRKFISNITLPNKYSEFNYFGAWPESQSRRMPTKLIGYSDGMNIIKTEYYNSNIKIGTKYDTIISQGCGSTNNYTITLN